MNMRLGAGSILLVKPVFFLPILMGEQLRFYRELDFQSLIASKMPFLFCRKLLKLQRCRFLEDSRER